MTLFEPRPSSTRADLAHSTTTAPVVRRNCRARTRVGSDRSHVRFRQYSVGVRFAARGSQSVAFIRAIRRVRAVTKMGGFDANGVIARVEHGKVGQAMVLGGNDAMSTDGTRGDGFNPAITVRCDETCEYQTLTPL